MLRLAFLNISTNKIWLEILSQKIGTYLNICIIFKFKHGLVSYEVYYWLFIKIKVQNVLYFAVVQEIYLKLISFQNYVIETVLLKHLLQNKIKFKKIKFLKIKINFLKIKSNF